MNKTIQFYLCFVAVLCMFGLVNGAVDEWDKLIASRSRQLNPSATLETLIRLDRKYSDKKDRDSLSKKFKIKTLIEASKLEERKCDSLSQFDFLLNTYSAYSLSIVRYLENCQRRQERMCELLGKERNDDLDLSLNHKDNLSLSNQVSKTEDPQQCKQLETKLFSSESPKLSAQQTLATLKELELVEGKCSRSWSSDILDLSSQLKFKCDAYLFTCGPASFEKFDSLIRMQASLVNTIVPLLQHCRSENAEYCALSESETTMNRIKQFIPSSLREKMSILRSKVLGETASLVSSPEFNISNDQLAQGLAEYLKSEEVKLSTVQDMNEFSEKFEESITGSNGLCYQIWYNGPNSDFRQTVKYDRTIVGLLEPEMQNVMADTEICSAILEKKQELTSKVFLLLH